MLVHVLWFILGLALLIKGGDWFVDGSVGIAKKFKVPDLLIGATVVSIVTTLPELMVSATSAFEGHSAMAYGNAVGSIICNTSLICAITIAVAPSVINKNTMKIPVYFFFTAAIIFAGVAYAFKGFSRPVGIILLALFVAYIVIQVVKAVKGKSDEEPEAQGEGEEKEKVYPMWLTVVMLVVGAAAIAVGARLLVNHGTAIAEGLGVPETVIALTFVALGTSLPELVTAITSLAKGHGALSLGNICGANLFNIALVAAASAAIRPFNFEPGTFSTIMVGGKQMFSSLVIDTPVMFLVMLILTVPALIKGRLYRWQGIALLAIYAGFCAFQFLG